MFRHWERNAVKRGNPTPPVISNAVKRNEKSQLSHRDFISVENANRTPLFPVGNKSYIFPTGNKALCAVSTEIISLTGNDVFIIPLRIFVPPLRISAVQKQKAPATTGASLSKDLTI